MRLKQNLHHLKQKYKGTRIEQAFNAIHTFLYLPDSTTSSGGHIRDAADLKRIMNTVIMGLVPCLIFGMFNAGYQHYAAINGIPEGIVFLSNTFWNWQNFVMGASKVLPLIIVSYAVGLGVEFIFATIKKHEIEEGYLVTGMLVPLILPVDVPLWMLAVAVIFGVVIGKEIFGGTGMNILNPALTIRAFLFFNWAGWMTGDKVWVIGGVNPQKFGMDAISGETILGGLASNGHTQYSVADMFFGTIPGSVGETSLLFILLGALWLIYTGVGSARIMISGVLGAIIMGLIFNAIAGTDIIPEGNKFYSLMNFPFWKHLLVGGLVFGIVFMATDPVSSAQTSRGKIIYGFLVGFISVMIRVFNPAYPEGVMMSILLLNVFAPTIDHYVIQGNIKKRLSRLKKAKIAQL